MTKPRLPRQSWSRSPATRVKDSKRFNRRQMKVDWQKEVLARNQFRYCPLCSAQLVEKRVENRKRFCGR